MTKRSPESERKRLRELIEEATVDAYDEAEQLTGLLTMIQDNVVCPFPAKVIGEEVTVTGFAWPGHSRSLLAVCRRNKKDYQVDITSLEWMEPRPEGFEWVEAYLAWLEGF